MKWLRTFVFLGALVVPATVVAAQTASRTDRLPPVDVSRPPLSGKVTIDLHPGAEVVSLDQLVKMSRLIVDGTVLSVSPSINRNPRIPSAIETHSHISVGRVLSGAIPGAARVIVLAQEGGKVGALEVVAPDDPLVQPGERYIFFLAPDDRKEPPNTSGSPRYYAVGFWTGRAKIETGKVSFLPRTRALRRFQQYDNSDLAAFLEVLEARINNTIPLNPHLPIHPNPGK